MADGEDVRDLVPNDERIRLIHIEDPIDIGSKRNFGCEQAAGDVICHFDDDDHSAPERISDQIARLGSSGKSVTGYHSMRFTDGTKWFQYEGTVNYALGTSLCYRKDWWKTHRFPSVMVGEDNAFGSAAWDAKQLATADAGDLMTASIHAGNTSPRNMGSNWKAL